jgi:hypothetical protein
LSGLEDGRRKPEAERAAVLELVRGRYADFGPTLAREELSELHGVRVSLEALRQWMIGAGLWVSRAQRRQRPHPPRYRRPCLGELVQIDGCNHEWFEARARQGRRGPRARAPVSGRRPFTYPATGP